MKTTKKLIALAFMLATLFAVGCKKNDGQNAGGNQNGNGTNESQNNETDAVNAENGGIKNEHIELSEGEVVFRAKVIANHNSNNLEVEIIDSQVAFGTYIVLTGNQTTYFDREGNALDRNTIKESDIIEIIFSGQVMNSYPPQIAAKRIYLV